MNEYEKIPVMLVDDSSIIRAILREVLNEDPEIDVGAYASNGRLALPRIRHYNPRVVILDYEMPEMNGLETLKAIREEHPNMAVIMFSSHTVTGAKITLQALDIGASDFVPKPEFSGDEDPREYIRANLLPRIKALGGAGGKAGGDNGAATNTGSPSNSASNAETGGGPAVSGPPPAQTAGPSIAAVESARRKRPPGSPMALPGKFNLCAIGISTGGPPALRELLGLLPESLNGSVVITQHMPPLFTEQLAVSLDRDSALTVHEARDGQSVKRGHVYIAPGGYHMLLQAEKDHIAVKLDESPPYQHCKPSVNLMFGSLVDLMPRKTLTVIMTGMGRDGYEGIQKLHEAGSYILAQSRASCVVYGMPANPTEEGLASESHDVKGLAKRIIHFLGTV